MTNNLSSDVWLEIIIIVISFNMKLILLTVGFLIITVHCSRDPYSVLGVSRGASKSEIQKAYRKLARKYHPDVSTEPNAEDKFTEIAAAYEALTKEQEPQQQQQHRSRSGGGYQQEFYFNGQRYTFSSGGGFNGFHFNDNSRREPHKDSPYLTVKRFEQEVLPDSYSAVHLVKVTSRWCFLCMEYDRAWPDVIKHFKPYHMSFWELPYDSSNMRSKISVYEIPSFLVIISGRVYHYTSILSIGNLEAFILSKLQSNLVIQQVTDRSVDNFVGDFTDYKAKLIFVSKKLSFSQAMAAFKYKDYYKYGLSSTVSNEGANLHQLLPRGEGTWQMDNSNSLKLFKEATVAKLLQEHFSNQKTKLSLKAVPTIVIYRFSSMKLSLLTVGFLIITVHCSRDPYSVLGVSRGASKSEIQKAYRKLARKYHPDVSTEPNAEDKFTEIAAAYEALTKEPELQQQQQHRSRSGGGYQQEFYFNGQRYTFSSGGGFNGFHFNDNSRREPHKDSPILTVKRFEQEVLPDSYSAVHLVKVTSRWCFLCMEYDRAWPDVIKHFKPYHMSFWELPYDSSNMRSKISVYEIPSFLVIISGRVYHYTSILSIGNLEAFILSKLQSNLVIQQVTDRSVDNFVGDFTDYKAKLIFVSKKLSFSQAMAAFKYKDYYKYGLSSTVSNEGANLHQLLPRGEGVIIFKEDYPAISRKDSPGSIDQMIRILDLEKSLILPKISSPQTFDETCKVSDTQPCVIFVFESKADYTTTRSLIQNGELVFKRNYQFSFLYRDAQFQFIESFYPPYPVSNTLILWRHSYKTAQFTWLPRWDLVNVAVLYQNLKSSSPGGLITLGTITNEHAPSIVDNIIEFFRYSGESIIAQVHVISLNTWLSIISIITLFCVTFLINTEQPHQDRPDGQQEEQRTFRRNTPSVQLLELNEGTISRLLPTGRSQISLLIVCDRRNDVALPVKVVSAQLKELARTSNFQLATVSHSDYKSWLLRFAEHAGCRLIEGSVIAVNFNKKYYNFFTPVNMCSNSSLGNLQDRNTELKNLLATMKQQAAKTGEVLKKFNAVLKGSQAQKQKIEMLERREEQRSGELQMVRSQLKRALDNPGEDYQRKIKHLESELANERSASGHVNRQFDTLQKQIESLDEERKGLLKEKAALKKKLEYITVKCNKAEKAAKQAPASSSGASAVTGGGGDEKMADLRKEIGVLKRENTRLQNFNETKINDLADRKNKDITARLTSMETMMQSMMESMRDNGVRNRGAPKMSPSGKRMGRPPKRRLPSPEQSEVEEPSTPPPPRFKKPVTRPLMRETALTDDSASDGELASQKKRGRPSTRAASQAAVQAMAVAISARKAKEAAPSSSTPLPNTPLPTATGSTPLSTATERVSTITPSSQPSSSSRQQSTSFQFPTSAIFDLFLPLPIITPLEAPVTVGESSAVSESPIVPRESAVTPVKSELSTAAPAAVKAEPAMVPAPKPSFIPVRFVKATSAVEPVKPVEPANIAKPVKPVEPVNIAKPVKPVEPVNIVKPVKPVEPVNIVKPVTVQPAVVAPAKPVIIEPTKPVVVEPVQIVKPVIDEPVVVEPGTPVKNEPEPEDLPVISLEPVGTSVKGEEPAVKQTSEVEEKPLTKLEPLPVVSDPVITTVTTPEPETTAAPSLGPVEKPETPATLSPVTKPETPVIPVITPALETAPVPLTVAPVTETSPVPPTVAPVPETSPVPVAPATPVKQEVAPSNGPSTKEEPAPVPFGSPDFQPIFIKNRRVRSTQPVLTLPPIIIPPVKKEEKIEVEEEISVICDLSGDQVATAPLKTSPKEDTPTEGTTKDTPAEETPVSKDTPTEEMARPITPPPAFHASFSDTIVTANDMQCAFEVDVLSTTSERKLRRVQKMLNSEGKGASPTKRLRRRTISLSEPGLKKRRTASTDKKKGGKNDQVNGIDPVVNGNVAVSTTLSCSATVSQEPSISSSTTVQTLSGSAPEVTAPVAPEVPTEDISCDDVPLAIVCGDDEPSTSTVDIPPPVEEPSRKRKKSTAPIVETIFDLFIPLPQITKPDLTTTTTPALPAQPLNSVPLQPSVVTTPDGLRFLPGYEDYKDVRCDKKVGQLITEMFRRNMYDSDPDLGYLYRTLVYNIQHGNIIQPDVKFCAVIRNEIVIRNGIETAQAPPPVSVLVEFFHSLLTKISEACPGFGNDVLKQLFMKLTNSQALHYLKLTKGGINFDNRIPTMFQFCVQLSTAMSSFEDLRAHVIRVILRKTIRNSYQLMSQLNQISTEVMLGVSSPKMNRKDNLLHLLGLEFFLRYGKVRYNPATSQWGYVHQFNVEHRLIKRALTAVTTKGEEDCGTDEQGLLCLRLMAKSQTWDWVIGTLLPEMFKVLESTTEYGVSRMLSAISHLIVSEITDNRADIAVIRERLVPCIIDIASSGPTEDVKMSAIGCLVDVYPISPESIKPVLQLWHNVRNTARHMISDSDSFRELEKCVLKVLTN
eukprot:sb/3460470/